MVIITAIAQMLSEEIPQDMTTGHTFTDIEQTTRRLVQEIGRQAIATLVNSEEQPHTERKVTCSGCGQASLLSVSRMSPMVLPPGPVNSVPARCYECGTQTTGSDDRAFDAFRHWARPVRNLDANVVE